MALSHVLAGAKTPIIRVFAGGTKKHYRINKLTKVDGLVTKKKDILARDDDAALARARTDEDCPVCEVREAGELVGTIGRL